MSPILVQLLVDTWSGWAVSGTASLKKPWVMDTIWPFLLSWLSITFKFYLLPPLPTPSIFPQAADTPTHFIWYICMPPCFPGGSDSEASAYNAEDQVGKIPWRKWQPTPVLLPRKSHGRRSLVGYSSWGRKESDMTSATKHIQGILFRNLQPLKGELSPTV